MCRGSAELLLRLPGYTGSNWSSIGRCTDGCQIGSGYPCNRRHIPGSSAASSPGARPIMSLESVWDHGGHQGTGSSTGPSQEQRQSEPPKKQLMGPFRIHLRWHRPPRTLPWNPGRFPVGYRKATWNRPMHLPVSAGSQDHDPFRPRK